MLTTIKAKRPLAGVVALAMVLNSAACSSLLEVENPGSVEADDLGDPALAATLVTSAIGHFECALGSYIASAAM